MLENPLQKSLINNLENYAHQHSFLFYYTRYPEFISGSIHLIWPQLLLGNKIDALFFTQQTFEIISDNPSSDKNGRIQEL